MTPFLSGVVVNNHNGPFPLKSDGTSLPSHGVYNVGVHWQEFQLGDMGETTSPVGDQSFEGSLPTPDLDGKMGQINVYEVSISGIGVADPLEVHFDLFNHLESTPKAKIRFAPFSDDITGTTGQIPEPASLLIWSLAGLGAAGLAALRRRNNVHPRWSQENRTAIYHVIHQPRHSD